MTADATAYGVSAVISHVYSDGYVKTIAFVSRTLSKVREIMPNEVLSNSISICTFMVD